MSTPFEERVFGVIMSAVTLIAEAPTAAPSSAGAVPPDTVDAMAPTPREPPPIRAAFFRLVHPVSQRIGNKQ